MLRLYRFKAHNRKETVTDTLPFANNQDFFRYLKNNNLKLISYRKTHGKFKMKTKEILTFSEYLLSLMENGIEITLALEIITSQEKRYPAHIFNTIRTSIINGEGIYSSFNLYRDIFQDTYLNLLNAGEKSGNMEKNLKKACENLKLITSLKEKIKHALFYPAIVGSFILLLLIFIFTSVLPNFEEFFRGSENELPGITKFLLAVSNNFNSILLITAAVFIAAIVFFKTVPDKTAEKIKINTPILKGIIKKGIIMDFSQNLYIMLESDIDILDALKGIEENTRYLFFREYIRKLTLSIKYGHSIHESFSSIDFFTPQQLKLINIGEKSGTLPQTFETISIAMQKELETHLFKLTTLIQPILLSLLGIIIGGIILAIYLPIFSISSMIL